MKIKPITTIAALSLTVLPAVSMTTVVSYWGFIDDYDQSGVARLTFDADVDNSVGQSSQLQAFLGNASELDTNGGGGFTPYTSTVSGITYGPSRTVKFDDLKGGGSDFTIGMASTFLVDENDGNGAISRDFGNDALLYFTLDGSGFEDFTIRFDAEGTPGDLPSTFDLFYRTSASSTWFRTSSQNNIPLNFFDYPVPDPDNQFADSGIISLDAALNNDSQIEIIISDFAENGNNELEIDNIEIVATAVPEPTSSLLIGLALIGGLLSRKRQ